MYIFKEFLFFPSNTKDEYVESCTYLKNMANIELYNCIKRNSVDYSSSSFKQIQIVVKRHPLGLLIIIIFFLN